MSYERTTTASRRLARRLRENVIHVSQVYDRSEIKSDETGVVTPVYLPRFVNQLGKSCGRTYRIGTNALKRLCKSLRISRVQYQRDQMQTLLGAVA